MIRVIVIKRVKAFEVGNILAKECYLCTMCNEKFNNATELRLTVNENDWCYKRIVSGIINRGSTGSTCIPLGSNHFCCTGHLCNKGTLTFTTNILTILIIPFTML
ncbi:unnamed protein product [Adineta steineri]|uniref:Uncharacterized protein n=1 Tax=Adineta steineri TaxID=433720 RepID=A0A814L778_9BILA|nr:unnamed protein product [Adineta steineri]CAF3832427.1 unnamed protein product [Adineta steineri]